MERKNGDGWTILSPYTTTRGINGSKVVQEEIGVTQSIILLDSQVINILAKRYERGVVGCCLALLTRRFMRLTLLLPCLYHDHSILNLVRAAF